jgi:hypothetical protein
LPTMFDKLLFLTYLLNLLAEETMPISFRLNDESVSTDAPPETPLRCEE